jgi:hypothetical protein
MLPDMGRISRGRDCGGPCHAAEDRPGCTQLGHNRKTGGRHPRFCPVAAHFGGGRRSRGREDGHAVKLHLGAFETPSRWPVGVLLSLREGSTPSGNRCRDSWRVEPLGVQ